jgi:hypothetical protein
MCVADGRIRICYRCQTEIRTMKKASHRKNISRCVEQLSQQQREETDKSNTATIKVSFLQTHKHRSTCIRRYETLYEYACLMLLHAAESGRRPLPDKSYLL